MNFAASFCILLILDYVEVSIVSVLVLMNLNLIQGDRTSLSINQKVIAYIGTLLFVTINHKLYKFQKLQKLKRYIF
jgi:hypothetical protein